MTRAIERGPYPRQREILPPADFPQRPRFVLYRIIGNDLVPRHRKGQARENLPFLLQHEPPLVDCRKRFVVNRIVDPEEEAAVIDILEKAGASYLHIPFDPEEFAAIPWDITGVPAEYIPGSPGYLRLRKDQQARIIARINRHQNNYVVHNNGARNAALAEGRELGDWILPWDGNCYLSESAWQQIKDRLTERPNVPFWLVPMARLTDIRQLTDAENPPQAREEPQVIFRADCPLAFDPRFFYGRRPKVELFWRLGIPGKWDHWGIEPWDLPCPEFDPHAGAWDQVSWVARLPSGQAALEQGHSRSATDRARAQARAEATVGLFDKLEYEALMPRLAQSLPILRTGAERLDQELAGWVFQSVSSARPRSKCHQQQCAHAFLLALASNFQTVIGLRDQHSEPDYDQKARRLILQLCASKSSSGIRTFLSENHGAMRPQPGLFLLLEAVRYLALAGTLDGTDLDTITSWVADRNNILDTVWRRTIARDNSTREAGAHYLEAAAIAHFLQQPLALRDAIRDAQIHFYTLFEQDHGAAGAGLLNHSPHIAAHWLHLIDLAEDLFTSSRLEKLRRSTIADALHRAGNLPGTNQTSRGLLEMAHRYALGQSGHSEQAGTKRLEAWPLLDRRLRFRIRQQPM